MTPVLELADVTFRRNGKQILDGISLTVHAGEHWALLGPNGAGKSTLLGFCAAMQFPTTGTVRILGEQMGRVDLARLRPLHRSRQPAAPTAVLAVGTRGGVDRHHGHHRHPDAVDAERGRTHPGARDDRCGRVVAQGS